MAQARSIMVAQPALAGIALAVLLPGANYHMASVPRSEHALVGIADAERR